MTFLPQLFALSTRMGPRMVQLGDSPSLLVLALLMDGVLALAAAPFRFHKETLT